MAPHNPTTTSPAAASVAGDDGFRGVAVRDVCKQFGTVTALADAHLDLPPGKVTALVGDNGAGKSTLVKVISGVLPCDTGEISVNGSAVTLDSPLAAMRLGVHTVYQDLALADNLDVVENLFLGSETRRRLGRVRLPWLARRAMEKEAEDLLGGLGITTIGSVRQRIEMLSGGQRQTVAIARAVREHATLVILDEPTAALGVIQSAQVMQTIQELRATGTSVLLVSHNLREVFAVSDRIAVMRLGRIAAVFDTADTHEEEIVAEIVGRRDEGGGHAGPDQ